MTYVKLHGGIIYSSIWSAPDHVRIVWVTMLAMKDHRGLVDASAFGIAKAAHVSYELALDALEHLQRPDPYSKTPDNEGRRIAPSGDGWLVLNHFKYRGLADNEERKAKDAERKRESRAADASADVRKRPRSSRTVRDRPRSPQASAKSEMSDIRSDQISGEERAVDPHPGPEPSSPEPPDHGGGGEHAQALHGAEIADPVPRTPADGPGGRTVSPVRAFDPDSRGSEAGRIVRALSAEHARRFNALRSELGAKVPAMQLIGDPAERSLRELVKQQVSLEGFAGKARHVLDVREAEARKTGSLKFFGASVWGPGYATALALEVGEEFRSARSSGPSVFDIVDQTVAKIEAEEQERNRDPE